MDVVFGFSSLLLDSEWLRTQFDAHPRDMWMSTAVVFVVATGVGYLMGVTYGRFRYVRVEKERDMANERVFQLEADLRTERGRRGPQIGHRRDARGREAHERRPRCREGEGL